VYSFLTPWAGISGLSIIKNNNRLVGPDRFDLEIVMDEK
jgi:hypothetical protein